MVGVLFGCWNYELEQRSKLIARVIFLLSIAFENSRIYEYNPTPIAVNLVSIGFSALAPQAFPELPQATLVTT